LTSVQLDFGDGGYSPLCAGSTLALGGLIHYVLENEKDFREYVIHYTNASCILPENFKDTEDLEGVFWLGRTTKIRRDNLVYEGCAEHKKAVAWDASAHCGHCKTT
jgi:formate dehydrogenase major subunit